MTTIEWTRHTKSAAARIGIPIAEYASRQQAGEKWCIRCKAWHAVDRFGVDRSRGDGRSSRCLINRQLLTVDQRRERNRVAYRQYYAGKGGDAIRARVKARKRGMQPIEPRHRESVFEVFDGLCAYCGKPAAGIDHIVPVSQGGHSGRGNLLPACVSCNSRKRTRSLDEFLAQSPNAILWLIGEEMAMESIL